MSKQKIVLASENEKVAGEPLKVVRFRMPSWQRVGLTPEEKRKYFNAYMRAWVHISRLGIKDTTSTVLTRKPKEKIEEAVQKAINAYVQEGLAPPDFTKTIIQKEEEESWLNSVRVFVQERLSELQRELNDPEVMKDKGKTKRIQKLIREIQEKMAELDPSWLGKIREALEVL